MYPNHNNQPGNQPPGQYPKPPQGSHPMPPQQNTFLQPQMMGGGQPGFNGQTGFPAGGSQGNRGVYTSMIVPQSSPSMVPPNKGLGGFGKLESMGRVIKQQPEPVVRVSEAPTPHTQQPPSTLSFRGSNEKPKMSSSVIFPRHEENISFQQSSGQGFGTSRLDSMMGKGKSLELSSEDSLETAEDKRKREIGSIKEELNKLNRRMEHFNFKKPGDEANNQSKAGEDGQSKPYFQLPSRKAPTTQSPQEKSGDAHLNAFKNFASGSSGSSSSSTAPSYSTPSTPNYTNPSSGYTNYSGVPGKGNEGVAQLQVRPEAQMQHSLSDNEIRTQAPKREEPGNMFKKKVMTYEPDQSHTAPAAKTFLLSPKGQPPSLPFQSTSIKSPAETVQLPSPGKALRRVDSTTHEAPEEKKEKVREFCKDDFVVGKKLGKGQFGQVMMVVHKGTGFLCAMKVMSKKQIREQKYESQVARQLSIQFYLSHRNVSPLYGYFTDEENMYLLVEYATGGQLLQTLRKAHRMEEVDCSPIIREICEGLDYIHKEEIIHRDIKPENILFNFDTVKICDFGWAVHCGSGMRKTVAGSPLYYSPEVVLETKYDEKIDIWAIGMMTYECILGKIPFRIYSELDLNRIVEDEIKFPEYIDVTEEVKDFILRICKKDPDERMEMRGIIRHSFITKYLKQRKVSPEVFEDLRQFLSQ